MSGVFRRCGCRDDQGKQYGTLPEKPTEKQTARACPTMLEDPKHGRWSFRLSAGFDPVTKKRRQVNGGSYATKREAQAERNKAAVRLDSGKLATPSREVYAEYLPKWLDRRARLSGKNGRPLAESTLENYRRYAEQDIIPSRLGAMKLRDIRRGHVQAFIDDLVAAGRGAVTVRRIVAVVQGSLTSAVRDELIDETPARLLELPPVADKEFEPWEPEQVGHFLDTAGTCTDQCTDQCTTHRLGALFEVAVFTGLRRAELVELTWDDVDLTRRELTVRRTTTKTDAGRRRVALGDAAVAALIEWQIRQGTERTLWGDAYEESGHVFTMANGRPLKRQYVTRLFDRLRVQAELPKMTFHGQRHQAASLMIADGADLVLVSKRLGHSNVGVTGDLYTHLVHSKEHAAASSYESQVPRRKAGAHTLHAQGGENETEAAPAASGNGL